MGCYQTIIQEATNCPAEDAGQIEDFMRHAIYQSTLDWQSKSELEQAAREAWQTILFLRSAEGKAAPFRLENP